MAKCYAGNDRQPEQAATIGLSSEYAEVGFQHESCDINVRRAATKRSMEAEGWS
jgi:hypothetical protein